METEWIVCGVWRAVHVTYVKVFFYSDNRRSNAFRQYSQLMCINRTDSNVTWNIQMAQKRDNENDWFDALIAKHTAFMQFMPSRQSKTNSSMAFSSWILSIFF